MIDWLLSDPARGRAELLLRLEERFPLRVLRPGGALPLLQRLEDGHGLPGPRRRIPGHLSRLRHSFSVPYLKLNLWRSLDPT